VFAGKKSAQIREILINESAWEEMTCLFALSQVVGGLVTFVAPPPVTGDSRSCRLPATRII
ncbi:hypothetical protein M2611_27065, partial [Klebsiella pneumoniae]|nr:hypothetical protein [Klebsiella pneumoniae]